MPNIVISNNGISARPAIQADPDIGIVYQPAQTASASIRITDSLGNVITVEPNTSHGLAMGTYTVEVI